MKLSNNININNYNNKEDFYKDLAYLSLHSFITSTINDIILAKND
jgi:hypothetical protein